MERVCIEMDLEEGLPNVIEISMGKWPEHQVLDYVGIPFIARNSIIMGI
jgi:hypothetical protein